MRIETPALVIYLMADHDTVELVEAAVRGGATAIEIGIPFSDPLADEGGQVLETHSISAGLDYPGVGPEHAWLKDTGRAEYAPVTDAQALEAFHLLCMREGIIPALESAHALWLALRRAQPGQVVVVGLSGRGDKDVDAVEQRESRA